jgi:hypothetical protein
VEVAISRLLGIRLTAQRELSDRVQDDEPAPGAGDRCY